MYAIPLYASPPALLDKAVEAALLEHFGTSNTTTFTGREAGRQAVNVVRAALSDIKGR